MSTPPIFAAAAIATTLFITLFSLSPPSVSAHFFPNISSIPPWLASHNATAAAWDTFHDFAGCRSGEKVNGLAKLKNYFHYFGYIDSPANFTDDFDDALESALKTYQKNFNLNPTGELDAQTLAHIVKPRCGNPDIINGTTTMNSGKTSFTAGTNTTKFHSVAHYTFFPGRPRWPAGKSDLTFAFLPANQLSEEVKSVFRRAFTRWAAAIPLTFTETSRYVAADIRIGFFSGDHGDGEAFDGVLGTLAHAFSPPSGMFHLDGDENWVVAGDVSQSTVMSAVDLESVAVHEIGHVLGLGHSSVESSIMYPTITSGTRKVELVGDDVEGIQTLYGANPSYNGTNTTTPSTQQSDTTGMFSGATTTVGPPRWATAALLAVGFAILMV